MILQVDARGILRIVAHFVRALRAKVWRARWTSVIHPNPGVPARPGVTTIVAAIDSGRGYSDDDAARVTRIRQHRMQTEPTESRHPEWTLGMIEQCLVWPKRLAPIIRAKERGGIDTGEDSIRADQRCRFERP